MAARCRRVGFIRVPGPAMILFMAHLILMRVCGFIGPSGDIFLAAWESIFVGEMSIGFFVSFFLIKKTA